MEEENKNVETTTEPIEVLGNTASMEPVVEQPTEPVVEAPVEAAPAEPVVIETPAEPAPVEAPAEPAVIEAAPVVDPVTPAPEAQPVEVAPVVPVAAETPAPAETPAEPATEPAPAAEPVTPAPAEPKKKGKGGIILILLLLVVGGFAAWYFALGGKDVLSGKKEEPKQEEKKEEEPKEDEPKEDEPKEDEPKEPEEDTSNFKFSEVTDSKDKITYEGKTIAIAEVKNESESYVTLNGNKLFDMGVLESMGEIFQHGNRVLIMTHGTDVRTNKIHIYNFDGKLIKEIYELDTDGMVIGFKGLGDLDYSVNENYIEFGASRLTHGPSVASTNKEVCTDSSIDQNMVASARYRLNGKYEAEIVSGTEETIAQVKKESC